MTRKEAIEILRNLLKELTEDFDALTEEEHEAFNMAISSLAIDDMNDMSRKEAIELLDNLIGMIEDNHGADYDTALHMAINSLKADEAYQLKYEHIPTITITVEEYMHLRECEDKCKSNKLVDKSEALDKIREEIENIELLAEYTRGDIKRMALDVIDKCKTESEVGESGDEG